MDALDVKTQSLKVKHYVRKNHSRFWNKARKRLMVAGEDSIFEALFRGEVPDIPQYRHGDGWLPLDPWGCPDYLGSPKRRAVVPAGGGAVQGVGGEEGEEEEEEEELDGVVEVVEVEGGVAGVPGDGSVQQRRRPGRKRQRNRL